MSADEKDPWDVARAAIDDILRAFLTDATTAEETDGRPMFLTDWVVVMAGHISNDDGTAASAYNRLNRDDQPPHITLGLLDYARASHKSYLFDRAGD